MDCPEHGIKIEILQGNFYFGYTFSRFEEEEGVYFYLHIHFTPNINQDWIEFLLKKLKPFLEQRYVEAFSLNWILRESYCVHGDETGCVNGLPFSLDPENKKIKGIISCVLEDCDELRNRLGVFLEETLNG